MSMSVSDAALVGRMIEENRSRLLAMLRRRIDPTLAVRIDPEEILTETFLMAVKRWHRFPRSGMTPYAWLYRAAVDCLIEAWNRETRQRRDVRQEISWPERSSVQLGFNLIGSLTSPSQALDREE